MYYFYEGTRRLYWNYQNSTSKLWYNKVDWNELFALRISPRDEIR